jgi:hypothetical protein
MTTSIHNRATAGKLLALAIVGGRYPHGEVKVAFPIEPEHYFVREPSAPASIAGAGQTHAAAA